MSAHRMAHALLPRVSMRRALIVLALAVLVALGAALADAQRTGHAFSPDRRAPSEALVRQLKVPDGFAVSVLARDVGNARMMAVGDDGTVYLSRPSSDDVIALRDPGGEGEARAGAPVLSRLQGAHGLTIHDGRLYVAGVRSIVVADLRPGGGVGDWRTLVDDLPAGGAGHDRRTVAVGPDGMLYVSIGSSCNACRESNREHAAILRARLDGRERQVYASGLRNTIGFAWHPDTKEMWGMDHGVDWRGDDQPPEELNRLLEGRSYGWPYCIGARQPDPFFEDPPATTKAAYCAGTEPPTLGYQAHSAPIALAFYTGTRFPAEYRHDAFVAMHGSWNRKPATGYKVVRVHFEQGRPARFEDFLSGFLVDDGRAFFGRPAGLAVTKDGALLVSDDTNGMIYRVAYRR
jgi:glucose/arabinose dehydrogenase